MDTLHIDVKGWPPEWVDMLKNYADGLGAKFEGNGLKLPGTPKDKLPDWLQAPKEADQRCGA